MFAVELPLVTTEAVSDEVVADVLFDVVVLPGPLDALVAEDESEVLDVVVIESGATGAAVTPLGATNVYAHS